MQEIQTLGLFRPVMDPHRMVATVESKTVLSRIKLFICLDRCSKSKTHGRLGCAKLSDTTYNAATEKLKLTHLIRHWSPIGRALRIVDWPAVEQQWRYSKLLCFHNGPRVYMNGTEHNEARCLTRGELDTSLCSDITNMHQR